MLFLNPMSLGIPTSTAPKKLDFRHSCSPARKPRAREGTKSLTQSDYISLQWVPSPLRGKGTLEAKQKVRMGGDCEWVRYCNHFTPSPCPFACCASSSPVEGEGVPLRSADAHAPPDFVYSKGATRTIFAAWFAPTQKCAGLGRLSPSERRILVGPGMM